MHKLNQIEQLIYLFSKLPGLGQRSARRIVLHLLEQKEIRLKTLMHSISEAFEHIVCCKICNNLDNAEICFICSSKTRDNSIIAVVESVAELLAIERSGIFNGKYHVLQGLSSNENKNQPRDLKIPRLVDRCKACDVKELIIATNSTIEGQTIAYYIIEYFKDSNIKITRLASGVPIGGELDYLDEGTLSAALKSRQEFD
jgi:recombination protein RecR